MPNPAKIVHDVIISGAGPVGLFLACELRLAGASVLVLEQAREPHSALKDLPLGLRGLTVPTVESLDRRNLLDEIAARTSGYGMSGTAHWTQQKRQAAGHFAGIQFFHDRIEPARWTYRLSGDVKSMVADMTSIETMLADRAIALGVTIRRGHRLESFDNSSEGVVVSAGGETFHGSWLVGCDGGRSAVRKRANIDFAGTEPEFTGYSLLASLANPNGLQPGRNYTPAGVYTYAAPGTIAMVDFDGGAFHRCDPTREHVEAVLRKISGIDVTITALDVATTWTDRAYQANAYRQGRVLLAGDAAHIHSPLGGQGLNLGLGDAMNLGWKLAAVIRGDACEDLLDTYADERRPVAAQILDWSRAQVALMRPSASSRALEAIVRDLIGTCDGATYFAERILGVGLKYDLGGDHPLVGRSIPDFELADGSRANEHLRAGRGLLLDFDPVPAFQQFSRGWADRFDYLISFPQGQFGSGAMLVRPDGIVAWAGMEETAMGKLRQAAKRWFGNPIDQGAEGPTHLCDDARVLQAPVTSLKNE